MRAAFVAIVVLMSVALGMQPASAVAFPVAGPFTGTAPVDLQVPECSFVRTSLVGTAELSTLGSSTVDLTFCIDGTTFPWSIGSGGSFTITGADGAIFGDVPSGTIETSAVPVPFQLDLIVTGGTGAFERATGTLAIEGTFVIRGVANAQISGTIDVAPPTPQSKADCNGGGWQNFGDDEGTPFRNQGQCIRYVVHHS